MKISIISDLHLGFGQGTEMEGDSFEAFSEALEKSLDCDLILIGGDMFDTRIPNTEIFTKAIEILRKSFSKQSDIKFVSGIGKNIGDFPLIKNGIPVIAISGNHERRVKGLLNPVQALERAGFLVYLHCNGIVLEKEELADDLELGKSEKQVSRIAIHGMSSVPDQYGEALLDEWKPKPIERAFNILILHQSIAPFLMAQHLIPMEKIPRSFNLYINGHVHGTAKVEYDGSPFIIPGSLLPTQITKDISKHSFCKIEIQNGQIKEINFVELGNQREIFYKEFDGSSVGEVENFLDGILKKERVLKPVIKIVLKDKNFPAKEIEEKYRESAIIYSKKEIEEDLKKGDMEIKGIMERVESVNDLGRKLLRENLQKNGLDPQTFENIFELLENNKVKEAEQILEKVAIGDK